MQVELKSGKLLDDNGHLFQAGYAKSLVKDYLRSDIKAPKGRIKEWDYYIVTDGKTATAYTIADNSYMALISVSFLDFSKATYTTTSVMKWFTNGKLNLPSTSAVGNLEYVDKRVALSYINDGSKRIIDCHFTNWNKQGQTITSHIETLSQPSQSMVIATPFADKPKAFYYNQKINCMQAEGYTTIGETTYNYDKKDSLLTLDWGRGVWTYKNTWYWASLSTYVDGAPVGFNLGYGFGDTSAASENMIFYNGVAHKTEQVVFNIPTKDGKDDFMSPWTFTSSDKRVELDFVPIVDRFDDTNALIISTNQHQVFGKYSGKLTLDDGAVIILKDALGFAEKVRNKW